MACPYTITKLLCNNNARSPIVAVPNDFSGCFFQFVSLDFPNMQLWPTNCWNFEKPIRYATYEAIKTIVRCLIFRRIPKWFGNPVFKEGERWNLMTFLPNAVSPKLGTFNWLLVKLSLETSKTILWTSFLKTI